MEQFNKKETIFTALRHSIELDSDLLGEIKDYISIIESDYKSNEYCEIYFLNSTKSDCIFFIEPNIAGGEHLPKEMGVSLTTAPDAVMSKEEFEIFKNCDLYCLFESIENYENIFINFSFDAETLCAAIQYLAQCYDCPIEEIRIRTEYNNFDNGNNKVSHNSGCAGMLALILGISCTMGYGIVELIDRFIA